MWLPSWRKLEHPAHLYLPMQVWSTERLTFEPSGLFSDFVVSSLW